MSFPVTFIINPAAGGAAGLDSLEDDIRLAFPDGEMRTAAHAGDATNLARAAAEAGRELVVAVGGDGTLHEVVNGLAGASFTGQIGLLPMGTGNDFARAIGLPTALPLALACLQKRRTARIDLACITGTITRYMINMSGGGFTALVNDKLTDEVKATWGPLSYARSFLEALPEREAYRSTITLDGEVLGTNAYSVFVANSRYVASGIPMAPRAILDDGLLDIVILPVTSLARIAVLTPVTLSGAHLESEDIFFRRAREIRIESEPPMRFNADGEPLPEGPLTFECLPRVLEFVIGDLPLENSPLSAV